MLNLAGRALPLTWRRHRVVAALGLAAVLAICAVQLIGAIEAGSINARLQFPLCDTGCQTNYDLEHSLVVVPLITPLRWLITLVPGLAGLLLGAPLVPRELRRNRDRAGLRRWLGEETVRLVLATTVLTGALALTSIVLDSAGDRGLFIAWNDYDMFLVLCGHALFALALGVAAGAVVRRTLPALALTLVLFAGVMALMTASVRPCFLPPLETNPNDVALHDVTFQHAPTGAWLLDPPPVTSGDPDFRPPCVVGRPDYWYQPAGRLWLFQGIESAIFVPLAALLFALALWLSGRPDFDRSGSERGM